MFKINNNDFRILNMCKDFSNYLDNILENIPRKDMYYKDKLRTSLYDMLDYILKCSYDDNKSRLEYYNINIKASIAFIDFMLDRLYNKKYINEKVLHKLIFYLIEINKMVTSWLKGKINAC